MPRAEIRKRSRLQIARLMKKYYRALPEIEDKANTFTTTAQLNKWVDLNILKQKPSRPV